MTLYTVGHTMSYSITLQWLTYTFFLITSVWSVINLSSIAFSVSWYSPLFHQVVGEMLVWVPALCTGVVLRAVRKSALSRTNVLSKDNVYPSNSYMRAASSAIATPAAEPNMVRKLSTAVTYCLRVNIVASIPVTFLRTCPNKYFYRMHEYHVCTSL